MSTSSSDSGSDDSDAVLPNSARKPQSTVRVRSTTRTTRLDAMNIDSGAGFNTTLGSPSPGEPATHIPETPFAPPYRSIFSLTPPVNTLLPLLRHVNCSYLSTPGLPPTLTQLKQHAQSLTILIKHLTISTKAAAVDNAAYDDRNGEAGPMNGNEAFIDGESYDFLNDLTSEYEGPRMNEGMRTHHDMPLTTLLNLLERKGDVGGTEGGVSKKGRLGKRARMDMDMGTNVRGCNGMNMMRDICPLHRSDPAPVNGPSLPYATHEALIKHANEVLELLDHEYSAKGGLLSILPRKEAVEDRKLAEATLLGQMILYMQRMVQRLHDLERAYANAMDVIAGEAVVPRQALSRLGPDGRRGRELVYPQDRFVLVNAGEDVWSFLDREFVKKEKADEKVAENYKSMGLAGEAIWEKRGAKEMARGITALDVTTRYYRLRKDPLKTIFVIPAHQEHPGTKVTRDMEKQPTVVSVVKPVWPERASTWEMKHRSDLEDLKRLRQEHSEAVRKLEWMEDEKKVLVFEIATKNGEFRQARAELEERIDALNDQLDKVPKEEREQRRHRRENDQAVLRAKEAAIEEEERQKAALELERREVAQARQQLAEEREALNKSRQARVRKDVEALTAHNATIEARDREQAAAAQAMSDKLQAAWAKQITETQVMVEYLKRHRVDFDSGATAKASAEDRAAAKVEAERIMREANEKEGWEVPVEEGEVTDSQRRFVRSGTAIGTGSAAPAAVIRAVHFQRPSVQSGSSESERQ